ncbi:MAG: flagellar motor protein MotB [Rhodospirillales bacterium]
METQETISHVAGEEKAGGVGSLALFLGLYLLVLAFFILLVSISTLEEVKSRAVMDSLSSTFSSIFPPSTDLTAFTSKEGDVLAAQQFQEQITNIFTTSIRVEKIEVIQAGRKMRLSIRSDSLFFTGKTTIRAAKVPLLDRIVASLSARPPGLHFDMELVIGSEYAGGKSLPIGQTLEMARAGAFAREMQSRGVPPDSVVVGIMHGNPDEILIWFYVRNVDEIRLKFGEGVFFEEQNGKADNGKADNGKADKSVRP